MLYSLLFNIVFLILMAVCVYYTILYTQLGEDIAEIKSVVRQCNAATTTKSFRSKSKKTQTTQ